MAGLDLTRLRPRLYPKLLLDRGELRRDPEGDVDDVVDPNTGVITPPSGDLQLVADTECLLTNRQVLGGMSTEAGRALVITQYVVLFPITVEPKPGDWLMMLESKHDPQMVGKPLRLEEIVYSSLEIFKRARAAMREESEVEA